MLERESGSINHDWATPERERDRVINETFGNKLALTEGMGKHETILEVNKELEDGDVDMHLSLEEKSLA